MNLLPKWAARESRASAIPLAICRILFGLCLVFDIWALIDYAPMWFDGVPYVEPAPRWVELLLFIWLSVAIGLTVGAFSRVCASLNYLANVIFIGFFAMPASCEFHPDALFLSTSFVLPFLPISRVWSLDAWRNPPTTRSIGPGSEIFFALLVSSIYLDSALWKLSSTMWMNGLGYWTPATQPWPEQLSFAWSLENEWVAKTAGYGTLIFELSFAVLVWFRPLRWLLLLIGLLLHVGIGVVFPLPIFGLIMVALLAALVPLKAPDEGLLAVERTGLVRRFVPAYFALWASVSLLGVLHPLSTLSRVGLGGSNGQQHRPWYAASETTLQRAVGAGFFWVYRLFGFRTHHIFLDDQFTRYTTQTRLRFHSADAEAPSPWTNENKGVDFFPPAYNRRFKAWHYRTAYALLPLRRVEERLRRWLNFHHGHGDIDLHDGWVTIEQRPIHMPIDAWVPGQRQRNLETPWRLAGVARGAPGAIEFEWQQPCWPTHQ